MTNDTCRQQEACSTFEEMSKTAKAELTMQKERRVAHFQKSVAELAELEVKHAKAHAQMLRQVILASDWSLLSIFASDWLNDTNLTHVFKALQTIKTEN